MLLESTEIDKQQHALFQITVKLGYIEISNFIENTDILIGIYQIKQMEILIIL